MNTRTRFTSLAIAILLMAVAITPASALNLVQARDLSMGMASAGDAIGIRVVGFNPAFLAFEDQPAVSVNIPALNVGFRFGNDAWNNATLNTYFKDGEFLDEGDKAELLAEVEDKMVVSSDISTRLLGFSFPARYLEVAFTYDIVASYEGRMDRDFIDLAFFGNPYEDLGRLRDFSETRQSHLVASRAGLTFAKPFKFDEKVSWLDEFTAGFTFNYFIGHSFSRIDEARGHFYTDRAVTDVEAYFEMVGAGYLTANNNPDDAFTSDNPAAGYGVGLDLGVGAKVLDGRGTVGISVINLLNEMTWNEGTRHIFALQTDAVPIEGLDDPVAYFDRNFTQVDSSLGKDLELTTALPRQFRLDTAYDVLNSLTVTGGIAAQTNDVIGAEAFVRAGFGAEYRVWDWIPLRAGMSFGGRSGTALGGGFGLHFGWWHTDVGFGWEYGAFDAAKGMRLGINTVFVFGGGVPLPPPEKTKATPIDRDDEFDDFDD